LRTPKRGGAGAGAFYRTRLRPAAAAEAALLLHFACALVWCGTTGLWAALPFLLVFFTGFLYNGIFTFLPARRTV